MSIIQRDNDIKWTKGVEIKVKKKKTMSKQLLCERLGWILHGDRSHIRPFPVHHNRQAPQQALDCGLPALHKQQTNKQTKTTPDNWKNEVHHLSNKFRKIWKISTRRPRASENAGQEADGMLVCVSVWSHSSMRVCAWEHLRFKHTHTARSPSCTCTRSAGYTGCHSVPLCSTRTHRRARTQLSALTVFNSAFSQPFFVKLSASVYS